MSLKYLTRHLLKGDMLHLSKFERKKFTYQHIISYEKKFNKPFPLGNCAIYDESKNKYECCGWSKKCKLKKNYNDITK